MSDLHIRRAEAADLEELVSLIAGFRDHLKARRPTDPELRAHLPRSLEDPAIEFHCAWVAGRALGFAQLRFFPSVWAPGLEAHLEDLFVSAEARGRSVGRGLLRRVLERAAHHGAARLTLGTNEHNAEAQALYRSEGFAPQAHELYPGGREVIWSRRLPR